MFYLLSHATHFKILFFGVRHKVRRDHSGSEIKTRSRHCMSYSQISSNEYLVCAVSETGQHISQPLLLSRTSNHEEQQDTHF